MPLYEFRCQSCGSRFTLLVGIAETGETIACSHCGSADIHKLVSKFMRLRSEDQRLDEAVERLSQIEDDQPGEARSRLMEAGRALDDDLSGEMDEMFDNDQTEQVPG